MLAPSPMPPGAEFDILEMAIGEHWDTLDFPDYPIRMLAVTDVEKLFRVRACAKEPWTVDWIRRMQDGDRLMQIGASTGPYCLIAAALGTPSVAIEPSPASYEHLCRNILKNRMGNLVTPLAITVGAASAVRPFAYRNVLAGASGHVFDQPGETTLPTLCVTLDALVQQLGVPAPTHLLIDVDGNEMEVLSGAANTLLGVRSVLLECPREEDKAMPIFAALARAGLVEAEQHHFRGGKPIGGVFYVEFRRP